jgi:hypothetical protein
LAKELTEAWASYVKVKQLLSRINPNYRVEPSSSSSSIDSTCSTTTTSATAEADDAVELYLFDMCSGKGFNVFIISKMLPDQFTKIYAIDKDQKMNLEHFNALGGVKFKYADVHHRRFNEWISRKLGAEGGNEGNRKARRHRKWVAEQQRNKPQQQHEPTSDGNDKEVVADDEAEEAARREEQRRKRRKRVGLFLGVHLCGELSQTFVGLYNNTPGLAAMILSPCCLPKHDRGPVERAKKLGLDSYSYWALQLYLMVGPGPLLTYKDLSPVEDVLSTKNAFITSIKRPFIKQDWKPENHHHPHHHEEASQHQASTPDHCAEPAADSNVQ